jgi:hypothetical protein
MTTVRKRARQERAHTRLLARLQFWGQGVADEITEVDGKPVDPERKLALVQDELVNLRKALGIRS